MFTSSRLRKRRATHNYWPVWPRLVSALQLPTLKHFSQNWLDDLQNYFTRHFKKLDHHCKKFRRFSSHLKLSSLAALVKLPSVIGVNFVLDKFLCTTYHRKKQLGWDGFNDRHWRWSKTSEVVDAKLADSDLNHHVPAYYHGSFNAKLELGPTPSSIFSSRCLQLAPTMTCNSEVNIYVSLTCWYHPRIHLSEQTKKVQWLLKTSNRQDLSSRI